MNGPYNPVDIGENVHVEFGPDIFVREDVFRNDEGNPVNYDNCHDLTGWEFIDVYIKVSGGYPSWDITPIFGRISEENVFYDAETITIRKNEIRRIQVFGADCFYIRCDGMAGEEPRVNSIVIRPVNIVS
jgi:hypothetical protein